jgi:hypothetical protein
MSGAADFDIAAALRRMTPGRPLVITDADEVILRFVEGLDRFLRAKGLYLDLSTYRLFGNVKRLDDNTPVLDVEVTALLDEFRKDLDSLELVEGAHDALGRLMPRADIVVLTNITPDQAPPRLKNLASFGLDLPLVTNHGLKGPAVKALAARAGRPAFFIDDIPQHLTSAAEHAPDVLRIHLIGDDRLKSLMPPAGDAHHHADSWQDAAAFIARHLDGAR